MADSRRFEPIAYYPRLMNFLSQPIGEAVQFEQSLGGLAALFKNPPSTQPQAKE